MYGYVIEKKYSVILKRKKKKCLIGLLGRFHKSLVCPCSVQRKIRSNCQSDETFVSGWLGVHQRFLSCRRRKFSRR